MPGTVQLYPGLGGAVVVVVVFAVVAGSVVLTVVAGSVVVSIVTGSVVFTVVSGGAVVKFPAGVVYSVVGASTSSLTTCTSNSTHNSVSLLPGSAR